MVYRVLQVVTVMNYGGLETMIMNYYRAIDRSKIQFDFLVHRKEKGAYDDEIKQMGGQIYYAPPIKPGNYGKYFKYLNTFFDEHKEYRAIHSHINENSGFILYVAKKRGIECRIAHSHTASLGFDYKFVFRQYARHYLKQGVNYRFACGNEAGKWLFNNEKYKVINNAIDSERFSYDDELRGTLRKELNISNKFVIGHVGRFSTSKNHAFLIEIFNCISKKYSNAELWLVGSGDQEDRIKNRVKELKLESKVLFWGNRKDVYALMQAMDVFLFPSFFEGLPVTGIEAQASGLKCIMSDAISDEVDKTGNVDFISLAQPADFWAEEALKYKDYIRENTYEKIADAGYDIKVNARWLQDFYLSFYKEGYGNAGCNNTDSNI